MKYYAVTEDPNELFHYGRLGMKWGQHIFGDKPKSPGYKRALGKLRASKVSGSTKKVPAPKVDKSALRAERKMQREQEKYRKAVQKTQRNMEIVQNLHNIDNDRQYERGIDKEYWRQVREARIADRQQRKHDRVERKMDKIMQQARQGKLKYGQLSDDQVQRVTQRLAMEKNARQLGSAEKTWRQQKKEAFRQGKLQGITRGTAAAMEEVARAGTVYGITKFMNRQKLKAAAKQQGKEERIKNRERNKKTHRDIVNEIKDETFEARVREGQGIIRRNAPIYIEDGKVHLQGGSAASQAKQLKNVESKKREENRIQNIQDRLANERDESFDKLYIGEKGYKNDDEALKAHKKALETDISNAEATWGFASDQAIAARIKRNNFNKADINEQKRLMVSYENDRKKREETTKRENAVSLYRQAMAVQQDNNAAIARYNAKMAAYQERLKRGQHNVKAPTKPQIKELPSIDAESLTILNSMGLNPYKTGGGGGKKNN